MLLLVFWILFERLGDEYISWRYVQHMRPYGTGINLYAFIEYFDFAIVFVHSFVLFLKSGIETPEWNSQWYQHLLTLFAIFFYESNTEGTNFRIMFVCFMFM